MPSYTLDSLQDNEKFTSSLGECLVSLKSKVKNRIFEKGFSGAGEDLLFTLLSIKPGNRVDAQTAFQHRWIGGKPKLSANLGTSGLQRTRRTRSTNDLSSLNERVGVIGPSMEFPHERKNAPGEIGVELQSDQTGVVSHKSVRRPLQIDTSGNDTRDDRRRRQFLPPVEPLTPSLAGAKTLLDEGDKLLSMANANNTVKRNISPMSPMSPIKHKNTKKEK